MTREPRSTAAKSSDAPPTKTGRADARSRAELLATLLLASASVLTAWSAFQATKWSGLQSIAFSESAAARAASNRATTQGALGRQVDVALFLAWISAFAQEQAEGGSLETGRGYEPEPESVSGFLFERFRPEFRPAMKAWLATRPLVDPDAPSSPFAMSEYSLAVEREAAELTARAEERAAEGRRHNAQSDRYVATTVILSLVLFFSGIASKLEGRGARRIMLVGAAAFLLTGAGLLASFPVALR